MLLRLFPSAPLAPGTVAPDFTLPDQDGNIVTLSELRGKNVVLIFYPADQTPVCTRQLCEFRDEFSLATSHDTLVFGVNPGSASSHAAFRAKHDLPFPLLVDRNSRVARAYNARAAFWISRTVYLIGKDGRIRYAERGKPVPEKVLAAATKE